MNVLMYTCNYIKHAIPRQVLDRFMRPMQQGHVRHNPFTTGNIDNYIIEKVIFGRVVPDINITDGGAAEEVLPLAGLPIEWVDKDKWMVHIPKQLTNGRSLVTALAVIWYGVENMGGGVGSVLAGSQTGTTNGCQPNSLLAVAQGIANAYKPLPSTQTSNVRVINEDTILVEEIFGPTHNAYLRCMLSHDKELTTISPPAWRHFAQLCTYACKAYIYNNFIIDIDMAELVGGQELGKFKEIVEGYSDAEELYQTFFDEKWRKIQFMSDDKRHRRFLKQLIGRNK